MIRLLFVLAASTLSCAAPSCRRRQFTSTLLSLGFTSTSAGPQAESSSGHSTTSSSAIVSTVTSTSAQRATSSAAASTIVPSAYYSVSIHRTRSVIDGYTAETIKKLIDGVKPALGQFASPNDYAWWPAHNGWTSIADFDAIHQSKTYASAVSSAQDALAQNSGGCSSWNVPLVNCYNDDSGWAALANIQAHETYGDAKYLERAVAVFDFLTDHGYVSTQVIQDGYLKGTKTPQTTIKAECDGKSMIGAVYWQNGDPTNADEPANTGAGVNAVSTGLYALTGAALCRVTGNKDYCSKSYTSLQWLDAHLVTDKGLLYDNMSGSTCALTDWVFTYNAGLYFAAYAQLGHVTSNATATSLAERTIIASIQNTGWNTDKGIIKEGAGDPTKDDDGVGFKSIMMRYLWMSHPWVSSEVQKAIVEYVNIQYYAITQLDSNDRTHPVDYGRNWTGPGFSVSSAKTNMWVSRVTIADARVALDVLNAISLNPDGALQDGTGPVASTV